MLSEFEINLEPSALLFPIFEFTPVYQLAEEKVLRTIEREIQKNTEERKQYEIVESWWLGIILSAAEPRKYQLYRKMLQVLDKGLQAMREQRDKITKDPLSFFQLSERLVNIELLESVLHLYSEQKEEQQRHLQKRVVGGCGIHLERKSLQVDPIGYSILNQLSGPLSQLQCEEILETGNNTPSGILFKLGFADLPLIDEEEKQIARNYLCPPLFPITDPMIEIFHAIATSDQTLCKEAADKIKDWNFRDSLGTNPLHYAACCGNPRILDVISQKAPLSIRDAQGYTPLHYAAQVGDEKALSTLLAKAPGLLDQEAIGGATALYVAAQNNQLTTLRLLLKKGANPNCQTAFFIKRIGKNLNRSLPFSP